jgi:hypothetical protein
LKAQEKQGLLASIRHRLAQVERIAGTLAIAAEVEQDAALVVWCSDVVTVCAKIRAESLINERTFTHGK